jgi:rSAM/selenodomain-associated transferase 1
MRVADNFITATKSMHRCALGIMAKAPSAGSVKTRLTPPLTSEEASVLSACFLRDTAINVSDQAADGVIVFTPAEERESFDWVVPKSFQLLAQRGGSLGDRLLNATTDLLSAGYDSICLINSDSPTLPPAILLSAIEALEPEGDRLVLGPAEDGGYYLIGLKNPHQILFDRIAWSTSAVLAHTVERARLISLPVVILPKWYDVDDAVTLDRLCCELFSSNSFSETRYHPYAAPFTREYLGNLLRRDHGRRLSHGSK